MNSLLDLLLEHRVPHREAGSHHHSRPGWVQVDCPLCSPGSGRFRLGWNLAGGYANCWSCGKVDPAAALAEVLGVRRGEAFTLLRGLPRTRAPQKATPRGRLVLPRGVGELLPLHRRYLKGRGFDPDELAEVWGVRGIGLHPQLAWRLFLPVCRAGEPVSWTARAVGDAGRRYINADAGEEALPAKSILAGCGVVGHAVAVVEGPFDAYRLGPLARWVGGVAYTRDQVLEAARWPVRLVVFDSDPEGRKAAARLCGELSCHPGKTVNVELDAPDPGSAGEREVRLVRKMLR